MADEETGVEDQPKSKKGLIIIVIVVVNLLILGGVLFVVLGNKGGDDKGGSKPSKASRQQRSETSDGPIVEMSGFVVNLNNSRKYQYLKAQVSVQLFTEEDSVPFNKSLSVVRNEILLQLSGVEIEELKTIEGKRTFEKLLAVKANERLDMDRISSIFFTEFVTQ